MHSPSKDTVGASSQGSASPTSTKGYSAIKRVDGEGRAEKSVDGQILMLA